MTREQVTDLGAVLAGDAPGGRAPSAVTLFDSTGLAIQDLAVAAAAYDAWRAGASRRRPSICEHGRAGLDRRHSTPLLLRAATRDWVLRGTEGGPRLTCGGT